VGAIIAAGLIRPQPLVGARTAPAELDVLEEAA